MELGEKTASPSDIGHLITGVQILNFVNKILVNHEIHENIVPRKIGAIYSSLQSGC